MQTAIPDISTVRSTLDQALGRRSALEDRIETTKSEISRLENEQDLCDLVCELFRQLIDAVVFALGHAHMVQES